MIAGTKASREKSAEPGKAPVRTFQSIQNMTITLTSRDHRDGRGLLCRPDRRAERQPARVATVGHEVDEVVKRDGRWLISKRTVSP